MISLNPSQKQSILFGFLDIHRRMVDLEAAITQSGISSPFSQHVGDLSPTEAKVVQDYFARIRTTMLSCLQEAGIPLKVRRTSLRWTLQVGMTFLHIAVAELAPERLRGYGPLDASGAEAVIKIQQDLYRLIDRLGAYLARSHSSKPTAPFYWAQEDGKPNPLSAAGGRRTAVVGHNPCLSEPWK